MESYANQNEASPSLGAAKCETVATFGGSWEDQRSGVICKPERDLPVPGGCELRNCRWFRWLLGGPAEWCHTQIRMRPRRPRGPRTAKPSPRSWAPGGSSGVVPYAYRHEASPSLGAAKSEAVATFGGSWRPSGVMPRPDQIEASPSLKGLRTAKLSPRSCASGRSSGVTPYADQNESSLSLWTANCESFATLVSF